MSAALPARRGLGRRARIKQGRDFLRVRQGGERAVKGCLIANWLRLPLEARSRLGVVVSKKVGNAVVRSRGVPRIRETRDYLRKINGIYPLRRPRNNVTAALDSREARMIVKTVGNDGIVRFTNTGQ